MKDRRCYEQHGAALRGQCTHARKRRGKSSVDAIYCMGGNLSESHSNFTSLRRHFNIYSHDSESRLSFPGHNLGNFQIDLQTKACSIVSSEKH